MEKTLLLTNLRQVLADDSNVMKDTELLQIINLAVIEYSRMRPATLDETGELTSTIIHVENPPGTYATIPDFDLPVLLDIATYIMLERIADDIVRRPDITDGQTRESWRNSAEVLYKRASELRFRVSGVIGDDFLFIG